MGLRKLKLSDAQRIVLNTIDDDCSETVEVILDSLVAELACNDDAQVPLIAAAALRSLCAVGFARLLYCTPAPDWNTWREVPPEQFEAALRVFSNARRGLGGWVGAYEQYGDSAGRVEVERTEAGTHARYCR